MNADPRIHGHTPATSGGAVARPDRVLRPEASVVLLRPRRLRGTIGILKRRLAEGWEVEIRSAEGTPLHLTLPERALHLR